MNILKFIIAAIVAFGANNFVAAEIISWNPYIDVEYKYYNVTGKNIAAIRANINKKTTAKIGKKKRPSRTRITSKMQYKYRKTPSHCYMKEGRAYNKAVQTLPKLTGVNDPALKAKFKTYVDALKKYERVGLEFRVKAASEVQQYYRTDPHFLCTIFAKSLKDHTGKIYKKWDKKMYKYWYSTKPPTFK